jgi:hypothetical protein
MNHIFYISRLIVILVILGGLSFSCDSRRSAERIDFGNKFIYRWKSYKNRYIIPQNRNYRKAIYPDIIDYDYNDDFVIALQVPSKENDRFLLSSELNDGKINYNYLLRSADSILKHDPHFKRILDSRCNYWIIDLKSDSIIGPLDKNQYLIEREKLHLPDKIKFHDLTN